MTRILSALFMLVLLQPAIAQRKINKVNNDPSYFYMIKVQGGSFFLGSDKGAMDRRPEHTVTLKDFYMDAYEVTQAQWEAVMGSNPSKDKCSDCPVTNVSWDDVQNYIERLNSKTGKHYRLPTEAEWEFAARGGVHEVPLVKPSKGVDRGGVNQFLITHPDERVPDKDKTGKKYSGKRLPQDVAWYEANSKGHIHEIGRKKANELGIYDMSGNAEEWCSDFYAGNYGSKDDVNDPQGPATGHSHVVRGGAWNSSKEDIIITRREAYVPNTKTDALGFRLVEDK